MSHKLNQLFYDMYLHAQNDFSHIYVDRVLIPCGEALRLYNKDVYDIKLDKFIQHRMKKFQESVNLEFTYDIADYLINLHVDDAKKFYQVVHKVKSLTKDECNLNLECLADKNGNAYYQLMDRMASFVYNYCSINIQKYIDVESNYTLKRPCIIDDFIG